MGFKLGETCLNTHVILPSPETTQIEHILSPLEKNNQTEAIF